MTTAINTVGEMTRDELKQLIAQMLNERLAVLHDRFEYPDLEDDPSNDDLTWDEVRALVEEHRWTPPPGAKSSLELLREDRDADGELYR